MPKPAQPLNAYVRLMQIDAACVDATEALVAFGRAREFDKKQITQYVRMWQEARAATMSYLLEILEQRETATAGKLFRKRRNTERENDGG